MQDIQGKEKSEREDIKMSNYANIIRCAVNYRQEDLDVIARNFTSKHLKGMFELRNGEDGWRKICYNGNEDIGVEFWMGKYLDEKAVNVQHRHFSNFGWWIDVFFTHYLASNLGGQIVDDGVGVIDNPNCDKYDTVDKFRQLGQCWWDIGMQEFFVEFPELKVFTEHPQEYTSQKEKVKMFEKLMKKLL